MMSPEIVPFTVPALSGAELDYIARVLETRSFSGDGPFTNDCHSFLRTRLGAQGALLTSSGTAALELGCLLAELEPGDEVIMPSYTFSSTANAVVLRGAVPVFIDVDPATLNLDPALLSGALSERTRAILPVHYAGVVAEMDEINAFARTHDLFVIEDAAQALGSMYKGRPAGLLGDCAAFSFHETKNFVSGEGGAFTTHRADLQARAEILREKGTNRTQFKAGLVDKYTWVDLGSSYLPSELQAAMLLAQFEALDSFNDRRMLRWQDYREGLESLAREGLLKMLTPPDHCTHNAHIFAVLLDTQFDRNQILDDLRAEGIMSVFHYVPLHDAPAGLRFGRTVSDMPVTDMAGRQLIRLPMFADLTHEQAARVIDVLSRCLRARAQ